MDFKEKYKLNRKIFLSNLAKLLASKPLSHSLLNEVEEICEFDKNYYQIIFEQSELIDIAYELENHLNELMIQELENLGEIKGVRAKIAKALELRIIDLIDKEAMINQSSFMIINSPTQALKSNFEICDKIWIYAGDKSTDFNYYSKRGLLCGVIASIKAYYFADQSPNSEDTRIFIKLALDKVVNFAANYKNKFKLPKIEDIPIIRMFS